MANLHEPTRKTETRHSASGNTCHHFIYHRLTCDEYDELRLRAAGRCELCNIPEGESGGRRLVVDHFEGGGLRLVRGLICDRCNSIMSCLDGTKPWGPTRHREREALQYEAASWHKPTTAEREIMAATRAKRAIILAARR